MIAFLLIVAFTFGVFFGAGHAIWPMLGLAVLGLIGIRIEMRHRVLLAHLVKLEMEKKGLTNPWDLLKRKKK